MADHCRQLETKLFHALELARFEHQQACDEFYKIAEIDQREYNHDALAAALGPMQETLKKYRLALKRFADLVIRGKQLKAYRAS